MYVGVGQRTCEQRGDETGEGEKKMKERESKKEKFVILSKCDSWK